ncbi:hypothetical protein BGZ54_003591, partial [Gamsiella multidivaricata]
MQSSSRPHLQNNTSKTCLGSLAISPSPNSITAKATTDHTTPRQTTRTGSTAVHTRQKTLLISLFSALALGLALGNGFLGRPGISYGVAEAYPIVHPVHQRVQIDHVVPVRGSVEEVEMQRSLVQSSGSMRVPEDEEHAQQQQQHQRRKRGRGQDDNGGWVASRHDVHHVQKSNGPEQSPKKKNTTPTRKSEQELFQKLYLEMASRITKKSVQEMEE